MLLDLSQYQRQSLGGPGAFQEVLAGRPDPGTGHRWGSLARDEGAVDEDIDAMIMDTTGGFLFLA